MSEHLQRACDEAGRHHQPGAPSSANSPDERTVPGILVGILDALVSIADSLEKIAAPRTLVIPDVEAEIAMRRADDGVRDD